MEYSMTETQTDPSPWDGLIERMQGRMMVAGQCSVEGPEDTASLMAQAEAEFLRECLNAIATARAAEAAQHQHEIAAKNAIIRTQAADLTTLKAGMKAQRDFYACEPWQSLETATARLAAVEAERDKAIDENIRLTNAEIEALRAERDRLKAALEIIDNRYYLPDIDSDILRDALGKLRRAALSGEEGTKP